ncbi:hypothetical protein GW796_05555 [archaeon]|nr:hypothetical protein [archaeon]NCQ51350.1 hypothetical protein [archaeon]NCT58824.1 hypothetical protein [archaeon]
MKIKDEILAESMHQNFLKESGTSEDIGKYAPLILPLVQKIYPESLVNQIASVQPIKSPIGKVAALYSIYTGSGSNNDNNIHLENSRIFTVPASADASFTIGSTGASGGNSFTVFYKENAKEYTATYAPSGGNYLTRDFPEKYTHVLVRIDSGNFVTGDTIVSGDGAGETLLYVSANRNVIKRVFHDYALVLENNSNLKEINFEIRTATLETKSRKIKSKFTLEKLQELKSLYNEKAEKFVSEYIANEIQQEIDREVIDYLKDIATPMYNDVNLTYSQSTVGDNLLGQTYDIYVSIFMAIEEIVRATKRNRTMFILADNATCSMLLLNPLQSESHPDESNPYRVGSVGVYPLYCDPYATEHYVLVGYRFESKASDDAGLIFSPYTSSIIEAVNPDTFGKDFMSLNRYGYIRHPQDQGKGSGDSDFFRYFSVIYGTDGALRNLTDQIRKNY